MKSLESSPIWSHTITVGQYSLVLPSVEGNIDLFSKNKRAIVCSNIAHFLGLSLLTAAHSGFLRHGRFASGQAELPLLRRWPRLFSLVHGDSEVVEDCAVCNYLNCWNLILYCFFLLDQSAREHVLRCCRWRRDCSCACLAFTWRVSVKASREFSTLGGVRFAVASEASLVLVSG